jgi:UDP-N-acetylglucosamine 1-carboxyvinyltransferase
VLAGLAAEDETTVYRLGHLWRGYEAFDGKIRDLGGKVQVVPSDENGEPKW